LDADGQAVSTAEYVARHGGADAIAQAQAPNNPNYNPAFAAAVAANTNGAPEQLGLMPRLNASPAAAVAAPPPAPSGASAGATAPAAGSGLPTDYLFTGQKWDSATGLYKMGDRYYDPVLGHFISPDPLIPDPSDPQQLNRYSYAGNNPLKYTDPTGHCMELGISPIPCSLVLQRVAERGPSIWQQIQSLAVQYSPQLTQMGEQVSHVVAQQLAKANSSSSASPGGLDPNKWDPKRLGFKSGSSLRAHFEKHVLERADEAWHELFGLSREELAARAADPNQMAGLQNTYMQWGQKASNAGNFIGVQAEGQQVFVDTSTKVTAILQGDKFVSLYRITMWQQFELSMLDKA
jgi:RHS repeat-associated protein